ncbi:MAG TPA: hypothetical protein VHT73_14555 [Thermodesulfobacteriota bacterium]|nr:hypothetical protein [Thermodesulfobacteriota bacterium]
MSKMKAGQSVALPSYLKRINRYLPWLVRCWIFIIEMGFDSVYDPLGRLGQRIAICFK